MLFSLQPPGLLEYLPISSSSERIKGGKKNSWLSFQSENWTRDVVFQKAHPHEANLHPVWPDLKYYVPRQEVILEIHPSDRVSVGKLILATGKLSSCSMSDYTNN